MDARASHQRRYCTGGVGTSFNQVPERGCALSGFQRRSNQLPERPLNFNANHMASEIVQLAPCRLLSSISSFTLSAAA